MVRSHKDELEVSVPSGSSQPYKSLHNLLRLEVGSSLRESPLLAGTLLFLWKKGEGEVGSYWSEFWDTEIKKSGRK